MTQPVNSTDDISQEGLVLTGLNGANPLGFLAALGMLRALSCVVDAPKLCWTEAAGSWRPIVHCSAVSRDLFPSTVMKGLQRLCGKPWDLSTKFPFDASALEVATAEAIRTGNYMMRDCLDLLAGFGVAALRDDNGLFEGTALKMVRTGDSQGNGLSGYAAKLRDETIEAQVHSALFETWTFDEPGAALRWSPEENTGYALQWDNPSGQPATSVRGANRLAIETLGILSVVPIKDGARTLAFSGDRQQFLTWPIWIVPVNLHVARSLICMPDILSSEVVPTELASRGIAAVFRCERIKTSTYYHNFTPAQRLS